MYNLQKDWKISPQTWHRRERIMFKLRIYRIQHWFSDMWKKMDAGMVTFFIVRILN